MIIDVWGQIPTERMAASPWFEPLRRWNHEDAGADAFSPATTLAAMDAAGVDLMLLSARSAPQGWLIDNDELDAQVREAPDRFRGVPSVDLSDPAGAAAEIRKRFDTGHYVGVRVLPWVRDLPPSHALFYPVYAAGGIPVQRRHAGRSDHRAGLMSLRRRRHAGAKNPGAQLRGFSFVLARSG